jgi:drug/metabolite transporter (DMT)-like permease
MSRSSLVRLCLLALTWGSGFLWIKLSLRGFTPVQIVLIRLALGGAVLAPIAFARGVRLPNGRRVWGHFFVAALFANALPYTLFGIGEETVGSNVAGLLNATTPLWTAVIALLVGVDRSIGRWRALGIVAGFAGTVLIFSPWRSAGDITSWAGLACLAASASYGVGFIYMGRYLSGRGIPAIMLSACQLVAGAVLMVLALPADGLAAPTWSPLAVGSLLMLGVVGTGLAYVLNYQLISEVGATATSTTTYLLPIVAVVLGALVVHEAVTVPMVAGMALVLIGVALAQRRTEQRRTEQRRTEPRRTDPSPPEPAPPRFPTLDNAVTKDDAGSASRDEFR